MKSRARSKPYIILSAIALVFVLALTVGWNLIFPFYFIADFEVNDPTSSKVQLWLLMGLGDIFLVTVITAIFITMFALIRRSNHIQRQNTFLDTISHELKTPITSLRLCVDTLNKHTLSSDQQGEFITRMDNDLNRLQRCIDQVLEANRLEHGERILTCVDTPIHDIAQRCCQRIRERYQLDEHNLTVKGFTNNSTLHIDSIACETILINLLDNAVKYSPQKKNICLAFTQQKSTSILTVSDHGLGIAPKDMKKLFKRFTRLHTDHSIPGTGLGLVLVENLATRMNMHIKVTSDGLGHGSTFFLICPSTIHKTHR